MTEQPQDFGQALNRGQIARAASLIMVALAMAGILGLVRQMAITAAFGANAELDAFYAALRVPETLFNIVAGGALGSAFIPVFSRFLADDDFSGAWKLASSVITLVTLGAVLLSGITFIFAEPIVKEILWRGGAASEQALTIELMRIMLVTVIIFGGSGLMMGILNGYQHFLAPALAPSLYNIGIIFGALALSPSMGVNGLAWGVVLGALLHLAVQIPMMIQLPHRSLQVNFDWQRSGVMEVLLLMGPRVLGLGIVQINFWVNTTLASDMQAGSLTALSTAFTLMFVILGVLGQSVGTAVFPTLSRLSAEKKYDEFWDTLTDTLSTVLFLSIPAGLGLAVMAHPIVEVLFQRGEWTSLDTDGTAWVLALFSIGLAGHAALEILARAFYSLHDTWTPVKIGGMTMLLNIILSLILIRVLGYPDNDNFARGSFGGLAISMSVATALESMVLWFLLRRRTGQSTDGGVWVTFIRTLAAALIMVAGVVAWLGLAADLPVLIILLGGVAIGAIVFWLAAMLFQLDEARRVPRLIMSRLGR